jgi:hypothetical protein
MIRQGGPLHGPPAQRRRIAEDPFLWRRFVDQSANHGRLLIKEQPNQDIFNNILNKYSDDPLIKSNRDSRLLPLKSYFDGCGWSKTVELRQKIMVFPEAYKGCNAIGRSYGSQLTYLPNKVLNTLYYDTHTCVDIVNSNFNILASAFRHLDIPFIKYYAEDRDGVANGFAPLGFSAKEIKMAFLSLIGSCPKIPLDFGLGGYQGNEEKIRLLSENTGIMEVQLELKRCYDELERIYPDYVSGMRSYAERNGKGDHAAGVALSYLCHDIEDAASRVAVECLQDGIHDDISRNIIWKFDGFLVPKTMVQEDDICLKLRNAVKEKLDVDVRYSIRPLDLDVYPDCQGAFIVDPYTKFKKSFEMNYFKLLNPPTYCRILNGAPQMLNKDSWSFLHKEKDPKMLEAWEEDPDKLVYSKLDCYPPPLVCPPGVYNTWDGYVAEGNIEPISDEDMDKAVKIWDTHVGHIAGHCPEGTKAFHDIMAHVIQKPAHKTNKIYFVRSIQGVGKDQMFRFISYMLGSNRVLKVDTFEDLLACKSQIMEGKTFVFISEADRADFRDKNMKKMKSMSSRETFIVQQKYAIDYVSRCNINMMIMTNDMGGCNMNVLERRFVCVESNGRIANDPSYHVPFNDFIENPKNQVAVYRWYKARNISDFNPHQQIVTSVQKVMSSQAETASNPMLSLMQDRLPEWLEAAGEWTGARSRGSDIWRESQDTIVVSASIINADFLAFHQRLGWKGCETEAAAAQKASRLMVEANAQATKFSPVGVIPIEKKRIRRPGRPGSDTKYFVYYFHISSVQKWIAAMRGDEEDAAEAVGPLPDLLEEARNFRVRVTHDA